MDTTSHTPATAASGFFRGERELVERLLHPCDEADHDWTEWEPTPDGNRTRMCRECSEVDDDDPTAYELWLADDRARKVGEGR